MAAADDPQDTIDEICDEAHTLGVPGARAVTHYGVETAQCSEAMERLELLWGVSAAREGILR